MKAKIELVGKTISGVVASPGSGEGPRRIWMLQFTDGTHVEFVSPQARRRLRKVTGFDKGNRRQVDSQMALNVA